MSQMTETIVDLRFLAESQPSLCIPRVFNNITEMRIRQVFDDLNIGKVNRIDMKERKNERGETFKRVYIHFDKWYWNDDAQSARRKLVSGKEVKIVYDNPWFWKVSASKWVDKPAPAPAPAPATATAIATARNTERKIYMELESPPQNHQQPHHSHYKSSVSKKQFAPRPKTNLQRKLIAPGLTPPQAIAPGLTPQVIAPGLSSAPQVIASGLTPQAIAPGLSVPKMDMEILCCTDMNCEQCVIEEPVKEEPEKEKKEPEKEEPKEEPELDTIDYGNVPIPKKRKFGKKAIKKVADELYDDVL